MSLKNVCRLCLGIEEQTYIIADGPLQDVYEKLTNLSLNMVHHPVRACYICYNQLKKCHKLMLRSLRANEILSQLLCASEVEGELVAAIKCKALNSHLHVTPIEVIAILGTNHVMNPEIKDKLIPSPFMEESKRKSGEKERAQNNEENELNVSADKKGKELKEVVDIDSEKLTDKTSMVKSVADKDNLIITKIKREPLAPFLLLTRCIEDMELDRPSFAERLQFEDEEDIHRNIPRSMNDIESNESIIKMDIKQEEGRVKIKTEVTSDEDVETIVVEDVKSVTRIEFTNVGNRIYEHVEIAEDIESNKLAGNEESAYIENDGLTDEKPEVCMLYEELVEVVDVERVKSDGDFQMVELEGNKHLGRKELTNREDMIYADIEIAENIKRNKFQVNEESVNIATNGVKVVKQEACILYNELDSSNVSVDIDTVTYPSNVSLMDIERLISEEDTETVVVDNLKYGASKEFSPRENTKLEISKDIGSNKSEGNERLYEAPNEAVNIDTKRLASKENIAIAVKQKVSMFNEELEGVVCTEIVANDIDIQIVELEDVDDVQRKELINKEDMIYETLDTTENIENNKPDNNTVSENIKANEKQEECMLYEELEEAIDIDTKLVASNDNIEIDVLENLKYVRRKEYNAEDLNMYLKISQDVESNNNKGRAVLDKSYMATFAEQNEDEVTMAIVDKNIPQKSRTHVHEEIPRRYYNIRTYLLRGIKSNTQVSLNKSSHSDRAVNKHKVSNNDSTSTNIDIRNVSDIRTKDLKMIFNCNDCGKMFNNKYNLIKHIKFHDPTRNETYLNTLQKHSDLRVRKHGKRIIVNKHAETGAFKPSVIQGGLVNKNNLEIYLRKRIRKLQYKCNVCKFRCSEKDDLETHIITHAVNLDEGNIDEDKLSLKGDLKKHLNKTYRGTKPYQCGICKFRFITKSGLQKHLATHSEEQPIEREISPIKFSQKSCLKTHLEVQVDNKPYVCKVCNVEFTQKDSLKKHLDAYITKPFECNICNVRFSARRSLNTHFLKHLNFGHVKRGCEIGFDQNNHLKIYKNT